MKRRHLVAGRYDLLLLAITRVTWSQAARIDHVIRAAARDVAQPYHAHAAVKLVLAAIAQPQQLQGACCACGGNASCVCMRCVLRARPLAL